MAEQGRLKFAGEIRRYILGGNSKFTIVNGERRFTYTVKSAKRDRDANWTTGNQDRTRYFVGLLTGSDNDSSFQYIGMMYQCADGSYNFTATKGSRIGSDTRSFTTFLLLWNMIEYGCRVPKGFEFWHVGSCCVCGRTLTVPESIAGGIGPECEGRAGL